MPKRVLDGEGLWRSDKLARVQPPSRRAEYANLIPLALANGTFEAGSRRIWSSVYSYNRPDVTEADAADILTEFERVKLLFRWTDAATGKVWGYWIGIEKPGRLPGKSRWGTNEAIGPEPPVHELRKFLESGGIQKLPNGNQELPGFGFGSGSGIGKGSGSHSVAPFAPDSDPRHAHARNFIQELHLKQFQVKCAWDGSEGKALERLLRTNPSWTAEQITTMVGNRFSSELVNSARPRKWLPNLSDYAAGPLDRYGKLITREGNATNRAERDEQQTHDAIANAARRFVARHSTGKVDGLGESNVAEATPD